MLLCRWVSDLSNCVSVSLRMDIGGILIGDVTKGNHCLDLAEMTECRVSECFEGN